LTLGFLSFGLAIGLGVPAGCYSAVRRGSGAGFGVSLAALMAVCIPSFVIGPVLVMLFAVHWRILPVALWGAPAQVVLPLATLGLYFAGKVARLTREGMLETLRMEHIRTARAKGLTETNVLLRHALPLGILPVVSYAGPLLADLLTGSFVVENLFQLPGIGTFMVNSSLSRDYPMVVGLVLLYAVLLLVLNLLVDLAYGLIDPRIRQE
jgi:oligopeptide transport system permease protein